MSRPISLKRNGEFQRLYRRGRQEVSSAMVLYCQRNGRGYNRLGLTVSVKVGNAVTRNRIRRRLREVYRLHEPELKRSWDLVLVGRGRARTMPWADLNDEFLRLCRRLNLLREAEQ